MEIEELKRQILEQKLLEKEKEKIKENSENDLEIDEINEEKISKKYLEIDVEKELAKKLNISERIVKNIIKMLEEGNTIPFIARYRKELTNSMTDEMLREFESTFKSFNNLNERKEEVLRSIDNQEKLTPEILKLVSLAGSLKEVEDIYRPYKQKKKTKATEAKRKGLQGLADEIIKGITKLELEKQALNYLNEEVLATDDAIEGAMHILAEEIADSKEVREKVYEYYFKFANITSLKVKAKVGEEIDPKQVYKMYYEYKEVIKSIPSHRYLAINRGENEKILNVKFEIDEIAILEIIKGVVVNKSNVDSLWIYEEIIKDSYKRLLKSSIENEIRQELKTKSDKEAIDIFAKNLKQLLLISPIKNANILGFDPGFRNGSKLATIDKTGKFKSEAIINVTMPNEDKEFGILKLKQLIKQDNIDIIAIGNGTASRESEQVVANITKGTNVKYTIVSEAGASVYSASKVAQEEFPDVNVSIRGAISIARRLQDPLSELVKIDPKSIGVGQYQHDVNQKELEEKLSNVVIDTVNKVGVDVNTATFSLLSYISGLSKKQAKAIVKYREENGKFTNREQIKKVTGIGEVAFMQAAGFLRIYENENGFDMTGIHPESYKIAEDILNKIGFEKKDLKDSKKQEEIKEKLKTLNVEKLKVENAEFKEISTIVIIDIIKELLNPGIDIRENLEAPILRSDILTFEDVYIGLELKGTVRNVTAFGAFVDIGLHDDGLVHISEISDKFVKNPNDVVKPGDIVNVKIIDKNNETQKISLSMKGLNNG